MSDPGYLAKAVIQGLGEGAIVVVHGFHLAADTGVFSRSTDDRDPRFTPFEFLSGYLDCPVLEGQCPLALEAVPDACPYAHAAVVANPAMCFIQQGLIEYMDVAHGIAGFPRIDEPGGVYSRIGDGDQNLSLRH